MSNLIFGVLFAGVGVALLARVVLDVVSSMASRDWPAIPGRIMDARLERSGGGEGVTYRSIVSYAYSVSGSAHTAARVRYGDWLEIAWSGPAKRIVQRYSARKDVVVRYNPNDPSEAVLEPGLSAFLLGGLALAVFFIAAGVLVMRLDE